MDVEVRLGADGTHQAGQDEQRVAGQEEPDEQAGLGEHDGEEADDPERLEQVLGVEHRTILRAEGLVPFGPAQPGSAIWGSETTQRPRES